MVQNENPTVRNNEHFMQFSAFVYKAAARQPAILQYKREIPPHEQTASPVPNSIRNLGPV